MEAIRLDIEEEFGLIGSQPQPEPKPKLWQKKMSLFGKQISVLTIVGLLFVGLASAALLDFYGTITGTANVEQSVILDGCVDNACVYQMGNSPVFGGAVDVHSETLINRGDNQVPIGFVTTAKKCSDDTYSYCPDDASDVISTRYYSELVLENKDPSDWTIIDGDGTEATLRYDLVSSTFNYELEAIGLLGDTEYVLIYYADQQNRFVNWGGDNPGAVISTFTTDASGYRLISGSENIDMNLPHTDDWNLDADPDYCNDPDNYDLCSGAKIWLVPSSDYDGEDKELTAWNPTDYLFETDMIDYSDSNKNGDKFMMNNGELELYIENTFNPATIPGFYKVTTEIVPA